MRRLNRQEGRSLALVLHDLNMAARYADHIVLFRSGQAVAQGETRDILTEKRIADVVGVRCAILPHPAFACPLLVPLARAPHPQAVAA